MTEQAQRHLELILNPNSGYLFMPTICTLCQELASELPRSDGSVTEELSEDLALEDELFDEYYEDEDYD